MTILPIEKMWYRVNIARDNSDDAYFLALMYAGEMAIKLGVAGMIAGVGNHIDRQQYRLEHTLVRADSLGVWATSIESILTGVPLQRTLLELQSVEIKQLTEEVKEGDWRHECCRLLEQVNAKLSRREFKPAKKYYLRDWFKYFTQLRNSTRGHGAETTLMLQAVNSDLHSSLQLLVDQWSIFSRGWAYLQRNYSGRYRVIKWNSEGESLDWLKTQEGEQFTLEDGVYINFGEGETRLC